MNTPVPHITLPETIIPEQEGAVEEGTGRPLTTKTRSMTTMGASVESTTVTIVAVRLPTAPLEVVEGEGA
jgi:hypothetical protein